MQLRASVAAVAACSALAVGVGGCGSGSSSTSIANGDAPPASDFPAVDGRTLEQIYSQEGTPDHDLVAAPSGQDFQPGKGRFGFGLFSVSRDQITDADVAVYAAHGPREAAQGPLPARVESLATPPAFQAKTTADDPDAAKAVYVTDVNFKQPGEWRLIAMVKDGDGLHTTLLPSVIVRDHSPVPAVGDKAPVVHTPTVDDVGDIAQIDTRVPHDTMHDTDLADVIGKEPVVLLFATPALCQSRVCGPVVDVAEQVKAEHPNDDIAFIHMEVYEDNDPNKPYRPQLQAYGLRSEPWLFVIDKQGRVSTRIEGAFSAGELEAAVNKVLD